MPQLTVITIAATARIARVLAFSFLIQRQFRPAARMTATATSDQMIRFARISTEPAGLSNGQ